MWEILGGLLIATAISGIVPLVNAEILVIAAAVAMPAAGVPLVALASTVGQMSTKTSLFAIARWAPSRLPGKARRALSGATESLAKREGAVSGLVFASAATGLPPFYGVSLATGALGMRLSTFVLAGGLGRFLRFGALAFIGRAVGV